MLFITTYKYKWLLVTFLPLIYQNCFWSKKNLIYNMLQSSSIYLFKVTIFYLLFWKCKKRDILGNTAENIRINLISLRLPKSEYSMKVWFLGLVADNYPQYLLLIRNITVSIIILRSVSIVLFGRGVVL